MSIRRDKVIGPVSPREVAEEQDSRLEEAASCGCSPLLYETYRQFVRRVFSYLLLEVAVTTVVVYGFIYLPYMKKATMKSYFPLLMSCWAHFGAMVVLLKYQAQGYTYPWNVAQLMTITIAQSWNLGIITICMGTKITLTTLAKIAVACFGVIFLSMLESMYFLNHIAYAGLVLLVEVLFVPMAFYRGKPDYFVTSAVFVLVFCFIILGLHTIVYERYKLYPHAHVRAAIHLYFQLVLIYDYIRFIFKNIFAVIEGKGKVVDFRYC